MPSVYVRCRVRWKNGHRMIKIKDSRLVLSIVLRNYATKPKPTVIPDETMMNEIEKCTYKPKNHPGIFKPRTITVPDSLVKAVQNVIEDHPIKTLIEDSQALHRHLQSKHPPIEKAELKQTSQKIQERVQNKLRAFQINSEQDEVRYRQAFTNRMDSIMKKEVYNWRPMDYTDYASLVYLIGRFAPEYAVLSRIFAEIVARDPRFKPRSLFDFGSGVGTSTWAANSFWKGQIFEYFNVDSSASMNDLAQILLQGGKGTQQTSLKGVFYRQFLPATNRLYDLVISAYSLLELPSRQARLETVLNLWNKTNKYLVVVERGNNVGFKIINEVRDFILHARKARAPGHVFSPCPHDSICPRFVLDDGTPCNFPVRYFTLPLGGVSKPHEELFCYIVLRKGERDVSDPQWPRVVREALVRSKHTICRMCTKDGNLDEVIFTASKHGKSLYHCARSTKWGDLLPITMEEKDSTDDQGGGSGTET